MQWSRKHQRFLVRTAHLVIGALLGVLVYAPETVALSVRPVIQIGVFPLVIATGIWLWYGTRAMQWIRRSTSTAARRQPTASRL